VEVPAPDVKVDGDGVMTISGVVRRRPNASGDFSGRVDIAVLGSDGTQLAWLPALLTPDPIPADGGAESRYVVHYGWEPPKGSTVHVQWVDSQTAKAEDAQGYGYSSSGYGGVKTAHTAPAVHSGGGHSHHMGW